MLAIDVKLTMTLLRKLPVRKIALFVPALSVLLAAIACGPPPSQSGGGQGSSASGTENLPELTQKMIEDRINGTRVRDVKPESGTGEPVSWGFDYDEPKEITVLDRQMNGPQATVVLDIKTQSSPRSSTLRILKGQLRQKWVLRSGWALREWEIADVENISMTYRDEPKPSPSPTTDPYHDGPIPK